MKEWTECSEDPRAEIRRSLPGIQSAATWRWGFVVMVDRQGEEREVVCHRGSMADIIHKRVIRKVGVVECSPKIRPSLSQSPPELDILLRKIIVALDRFLHRPSKHEGSRSIISHAVGCQIGASWGSQWPCVVGHLGRVSRVSSFGSRPRANHTSGMPGPGVDADCLFLSAVL
ncbi:uncharacterized protein EI97DRAFT_49357 [Westerdykella ornata]|uniref:Uncharacterized protein n=1 Tax=Westerdykella ornata TaxID=318751 RepID=A0A6A6JIR0_WESOR|nr:uncharacterized protein EI97DRAFT_49357 [Westerdykella ornata]KAF2276114.1 hypothetical protein EI97DRAFT_49357 [Westerdykella ornata]